MLFAFAASGVGCALLVDLDGFSGGVAADASVTDGASGSDSAVDGAPSDARADARDSAADTGTDTGVDAGGPPTRVTLAPCSRADGGSILIDAGTFCIDAFEVTQAQYDAFLKSAPASRRQIAECAWKTSFTPSTNFDPTTNPKAPVVGVDWCDAYAYCAWVGKRLCGRIDGGTLPIASKNDATLAQWYAACSNKEDGRVWAYGTAFVSTTCNANNVVGAASDVGSFTSCEGGLPGLFDMSGNVAEWIDSCAEQTDPSATVCGRRGGDFDNIGDHTKCAYDSPAERTRREADTGFRCCAD